MGEGDGNTRLCGYSGMGQVGSAEGGKIRLKQLGINVNDF